MAFARGSDHLDGDELSIVDYVLPRPNVSFLYRARGTELEHAGILRGDLLIVERGRTLRAGRTALVSVEGAVRLVRVQRAGDRFTFDGAPSESEGVEVLGLASRLVRQLLP